MRAADGGWARAAIDGTPMPDIPVLAHDAVLAAVSPRRRSTRVREAFLRHHARRVGDAAEGLPRQPRRTATSAPCPRAATAWRCSSGSRRSPATPGRGLPAVMGVVCRQRRRDQRAAGAARRALGHRAAHRARWRRSPRGRSRATSARTVGIIGCGLHGAWAARCLAAAGYGPGVCTDPAPRRRAALAAELGLGGGRPRGRARPATSSAASRPATSPSSTPATCARACT